MMKFLTQIQILFLLFLSIGIFAQQSVSGLITDNSGNALPGVNVIIKGTNVGVSSDFDGNYQINADDGQILVFSYIGYETVELTVNGTNQDVVMAESSSELDEVVVIGYGTVRKKDLTGTVDLVTEKDFAKGSVVSPQQLIRGKVAGVSIVSNSGAPGDDSNVLIRGIGSLNLNSNPLYVVDGVPLDSGGVGGSRNGLNVINPNDIEAISILKDASATAPYGARGSNGVIVITTKSGSAGEVQYQITSNYGFQNYAMDDRPMLTGNQRLELGAETLMNDYGYSRERATNYVLANFPGAAAWDAGGRVDGNWDEAVKVKDAPDAVYNFSASGGNATENFRLSLGHRKTMGTSIGVEYESISGSLDYKKKAGKVDIVTSVRVSNAIQEGQLEGSSYFAAPQMTRIFMSPVLHD